MEKKLVPYSLYLPSDYVQKLKVAAKDRKASSLVRDAIVMILDGDDAYVSGYKKGVRDCIKIVNESEEANLVAVRGKYMADILIKSLEQLENK